MGALFRSLSMLVLLGIAPWPVAVAHAAVVVVVSADSPDTALSRDELANLFLGRSTRFPDGRTAIPLDQPEGSSARAEFYTRYLAKSAAQMKAHWSKIIFTGRGQPPREVDGDAQLRALIAADPRLIGYIDADAVDASVRVVGTAEAAD